MRVWVVSFVIEDDGVEDPDGEVKGKYFNQREILKMVGGLAMPTAGLTIKSITVERTDHATNSSRRRQR